MSLNLVLERENARLATEKRRLERRVAQLEHELEMVRQEDQRLYRLATAYRDFLVSQGVRVREAIPFFREGEND